MNRLRRQTLILPGPGGATRVPHPTRAVVVGGGIAGIAAATILVERGVEVTLLDKEAFLGGRAASFPTRLATGETIEMERGFHAFFRQYDSLRALLRRVDPPLDGLQPLDDYPILGPQGLEQRFRDLPKRTPWQIISLAWRSPHLRLADLVHTNAREALEMLRYDAERTTARYDGMSATDYLDSLRFPAEARRMLFEVFAHSFFQPESEMSAAELLLMFHFYFTGNAEGLVFDAARRPLGTAFWRPFATWLADRGASVRTGCAVHGIDRGEGGGWTVRHAEGETAAELLVLALDVAALRSLVERSTALDALRPAAATLRVTRPFAVWRLWLDRPVRAERAAFAGTAGLGLLDNVSVYERFQDESRAWASAHRGSVVELHAYAVPPEHEEASIRKELLTRLHELYPETRDARIVDDRFLLRHDCPAFPPGSAASRPGVATVHPDLALAGDFVSMPFPCALMERAAASGMLAANTLLAPLGVAAEPLHSVPARGIFAPRPPTSFGDPLPARASADTRLDWQQADESWIDAALEASQSLPSGGWYVLDASTAIAGSPRAYVVDGRSLVAWRDGRGLRVGPDECPHLGAALSKGCVRAGRLVCPWHGLALGAEKHGPWQPLPAHDDGVLAWVRLDGAERATLQPILPARPAHGIEAVVRLEAECETVDVIANRLDPWHGTHFHPHAFARLRVVERQRDSVTVRVAYRIAGPFAVEVDARFACTDPRTIVMTIVAGEGRGSVVETHATPIARGRTAVVEATIASSDRPGFQIAGRLAPLLRPLLRRAARRLWVEDAAYAERRFALRRRTLLEPASASERRRA